MRTTIDAKVRSRACRATLAAIAGALGAITLAAGPASAATGDLYGRGVTYSASTYDGHPSSQGFGPAIDINRPDGDCNKPVFAPNLGTVSVNSRVESGNGYGNSIIWTSIDGRERILIAHLSTIEKTGRVRGGDMIALAGATGRTESASTFDSCNGNRGAHLHVERSVDGKPADVVLSGRTLIPNTSYVSAGPLLSATGGIDSAEWVLTNSLAPDRDTKNRVRFKFGGSSYVPVVGDWDGDGRDTPGVFQPSTGSWVLTNSLAPDRDTKNRIRFKFGDSSYVPVVGDWDGDGRDNPGLFQPSTGRWVLTNSLAPDRDIKNRVRFKFGDSSYTPVAGNWDGRAGDNPGLFQPSTGRWVLTNSLAPDRDITNRIRFTFGGSSYVPVAGNWDGHAGDNPGLFQPSTDKWVLTNSLAPDRDTKNRIRFKFGDSSYTPVAGNWDGHAGDNPGVVR